MGLDMYLKASQYVSGWDRSLYDTITKAVGLKADPNSPSLDVVVTVGYWRKANAIHAWFVKNVQGGEDKCEEYDVDREQLTELRAACQAVLDEGAPAEGALPTKAGFFFGSIEYDEYYREDLANTVKIIDRCRMSGRSATAPVGDDRRTRQHPAAVRGRGIDGPPAQLAVNTRDYFEPPAPLQTTAQRDAGAAALAIRILFPWHAQRAYEIGVQIERGDRDHALDLVRGLLADHGADMPARERRMMDDLASLLACDEDNDDQPEDR